MITLTYVHDHECERTGQKVVLRPYILDGTYVQAVPVCIETETELAFVSKEVS